LFLSYYITWFQPSQKISDTKNTIIQNEGILTLDDASHPLAVRFPEGGHLEHLPEGTHPREVGWGVRECGRIGCSREGGVWRRSSEEN
jgi:hypothetical protein